MTTPGDETAASAAIAALKLEPDNPHLLRGYGPLAVGLILFVLVVLLAPSVARERVVERPVSATTVVTSP